MSKNWEYAAGILWPVLIEAAKKETTLTYSELAPVINTNPLSVGRALGPILFYCLENRLPPLTVLIINKKTRIPGEGFIAWDIDDLDEAFKQVYEFNWNLVTNPFGGFGVNDTTESLAKTIIDDPNKAGEVYSKVKNRGVAQKIFRVALLEAYDHQCAMCKLSFDEALEAAHIIPWATCDQSQRISPKNGMLLCANHHKLFDKGRLSVMPDHKIKYLDDDFNQDNYSKSDIQTLISLDGKKIFLPQNELLTPDKELLKTRHQMNQTLESRKRNRQRDRKSKSELLTTQSLK